MSTLLLPGKREGIIKDPIHNFIPFTEIEREVIDTVPVQRLRRIKQLAGVEFVYPGGVHTRLEHVIGAMHLAGLISSELSISNEIKLAKDSIQLLRLAGLLHDVGHGPFSHVFEGILEKEGKTHEDLSTWIIKESEISEILDRNGIDSILLSNLSVGKCKELDPPVLNQIIAGAVDADKLDFIVRDSFHTGAYYGHIDISRLIYRIGVIEGNLAVDISALSVLESFIIARLMSFKNVYFHRVSRAVQLMLLDAMWRANQQTSFLKIDDLEDFLSLDDIQVWATLKNTDGSKEIIKRIERRDLLKTAYEKEFRTQDDFVTQLLTSETVREKLIDEIAEMADVSTSHIYIDVPTVPSVPYSSHLAEPYDILLMSRLKNYNNRKKLTLRQYSPVIDILRGILSIVRIYTLKEHREIVGKAAEQIFGEPAYTTRISM
ncbi:MAG: HD domain-containing protein [Candidatus Heimdallarchaeota archaeon]